MAFALRAADHTWVRWRKRRRRVVLVAEPTPPPVFDAVTRQQAIEACRDKILLYLERKFHMTSDELAALVADAMLVVVVPRITQAEHDRIAAGVRALAATADEGGDLTGDEDAWLVAQADVLALLVSHHQEAP
jgi:hypothetical protein